MRRRANRRSMRPSAVQLSAAGLIGHGRWVSAHRGAKSGREKEGITTSVDAARRSETDDKRVGSGYRGCNDTVSNEQAKL